MAFFVGLIEGNSEYIRILREGSISGNFTYQEREGLRQMIDFGLINRYEIAKETVWQYKCKAYGKKNQRKIFIRGNTIVQ